MILVVERQQTTINSLKETVLKLSTSVSALHHHSTTVHDEPKITLLDVERGGRLTGRIARHLGNYLQVSTVQVRHPTSQGGDAHLLVVWSSPGVGSVHVQRQISRL